MSRSVFVRNVRTPTTLAAAGANLSLKILHSKRNNDRQCSYRKMAPTQSASSQNIEDVVKKYIHDNNVMIFSKSFCPYCKKVKDAFETANIEYYAIELDTMADGVEIQNELVRQTTQKTVPNVFVNKQHIGGCDKTLLAMKEGVIDQLLKPRTTTMEHDQDDSSVTNSQNIEDIVKKYIHDNNVMVFSKSWCPYCKKVKAAFETANIEYYAIELDTMADGVKIEEELIRQTAQETVPNVFVNKQHIGGCDKTLVAMKEGVIDLLLTPRTTVTNGKMEVEEQNYNYDLIVIGGGSGGLACSKEAKYFDKKVCVLDYVKPTPVGTTWGIGGTCVNVGCIPKKLMHQASLIGEYVHDSEDYGWQELESARKHDWDKMIESIQNYIHSLNFKYRTDLRTKSVVYENSYGQFVGPHRLKLTDKKGKTKEITGKYIVVAVGGRPKYPDIPGDKEYGITSDDLFSLSYDPGKTIVVGASYVALECAGFLHGIGREVHILVRSILLRGFDQQMANRIGDYMKNIGIQFHEKCIPIRIERLEEGKPGRLRVYYQRETEDGKKEELYEDCNTVLFAIGREAITQELNLGAVGVKINQKNQKILTHYEQSSVDHIYAIGDCIHEVSMPFGQALELTPVAIQAGQLLAKRLFGDSTIKMDYKNVPTTIFTPIEYGTIGWSEEDAIEKYGEDNIEVFHSEFVPLEWSICKHREDVKTMCYCKLIVEKKTDRVIGFHVASPNAGEITQGYAVGMRLGATKRDFDMTVGIHPTCSEMITTLLITKSSGKSSKQEGC